MRIKQSLKNIQVQFDYLSDILFDFQHSNYSLPTVSHDHTYSTDIKQNHPIQVTIVHNDQTNLGGEGKLIL